MGRRGEGEGEVGGGRKGGRRGGREAATSSSLGVVAVAVAHHISLDLHLQWVLF